MSRKILFFINPISGTRDKKLVEEKIHKKCLENQTSYEILPTSRDGNYDFLHGKIEKEGITDIGICGGDGSISGIVSAVLSQPVAIGIIPVGSGNGLARTAGIPQTVDKAIDTILMGDTQPTDVFLINDRLSTHLCGLGYDAQVAHDFSTQKHRGLKSYTRLALKNLLSAKSYPFTIDADGNRFSVDAFLVCVANSNQFGNNFKVAPEASISDGLLDIVVLKRTSKPQAVLSLARQILSGSTKRLSTKDFHRNHLLYFQAPRIRIENPAKAPLHIDGDPAKTAKEFSIEVLPAAYRLIVPTVTTPGH